MSRLFSFPKQTPPYCRRIVGLHQQLMYLQIMTKPNVASVAHVPMGLGEPIAQRIKNMAACDSLSAFAGKLPTFTRASLRC